MLPVGYYPYDGHELTQVKDIAEQDFDSSTPEYKAIQALLDGNIEPLRALIAEKPQIINALHRIEKEPRYCTFLQIAAFYSEWSACAELWNLGANWASLHDE